MGKSRKRRRDAADDAAAAGAREGSARLPWSSKERTQLFALVKEHGPGGWAGKAARLGTGRSSNSLSQFYYKHQNSAAVDVEATMAGTAGGGAQAATPPVANLRELHAMGALSDAELAAAERRVGLAPALLQ